MWLIQRLAKLTTDKQELKETYCTQIRPIVELAVPYWGTRITRLEATILKEEEKVVKTRSCQQFIKEVPSRTGRYKNSTLLVITKIININYRETQKRNIATSVTIYSQQQAT